MYMYVSMPWNEWGGDDNICYKTMCVNVHVNVPSLGGTGPGPCEYLHQGGLSIALYTHYCQDITLSFTPVQLLSC